MPPRTPKEPNQPHGRRDDADAFVPDPSEEGRPIPTDDNEAESFAEEFIASATGAEPVQEDARDEVSDEEQGGPFLIEQEQEPDTVVGLPGLPRRPPHRRSPA